MRRKPFASLGTYVIRKVVKLASLLMAVSVLSFALLSFSPIDPIRSYIGAELTTVSPEQQENIAEYWGLNKSKTEQFLHWASAVVQGDLGTSMIYRAPVKEVIAERFFASLLLMAVAWVMSGLIGFLLGMIAGIKKGSWLDRLIKLYCYTLQSTPTFWLGLLLLMLFAVWLGWFPIGLSGPAGMIQEDITWLERLKHLFLPALTLSLVGVANVALHTRQKTVDIFESEFIRYARARGERDVSIAWNHGIRNIALPAVSVHFASFGELFTGSVLAEQIFSYPGLGQATVQAGLLGDVPLLLGIVLFTAVFVFIGNTVADVLYRIIDPRLRKEDAVHERME